MDEEKWDRLLGDLYGAATDADGWQALPAQLSALFGASMCALWSAEATGQPRADIATTMSAEMAQAYSDYFYTIDPWRQRDGVVAWDVATSGQVMITDKALETTEYYVDFARQHDTFHLLCSRHMLGSGGAISKVAIARPRGMPAFAAAEFKLLDRLIPHLRRSWQMRDQIEASAVQGMRTGWEAGLQASLSALPGAALAVDGHGQVRFANEAAERLRAQRIGASIGRGYLEAFIQPETAAERSLLRRAVADAAGGGSGGAFLLDAGGFDTRRVVVVPLPYAIRSRLALVLVTPLVLEGGGYTVDRAMRLFGLSRAEAEITLALVRGLTPREVADARDVSITTVRTLLLRAQIKLGARDLRGLVVAATLLRDA